MICSARFIIINMFLLVCLYKTCFYWFVYIKPFPHLLEILNDFISDLLAHFYQYLKVLDLCGFHGKPTFLS